MDASVLETVYVQQSYSSFAKEFDTKRIFKWTEARKFINSIPIGSLMFDAGCGNGRNMLIRKDLHCIGCDLCPELITICQNKNLNVFQSDVRNIPAKDSAFDNTICIAVIGHIFNESDRIQAIKELLRVTKGNVYIQCWNIDALGHTKNSQKFECISGHDYFVHFGSQKVKRYYHLFDLKEFNEMLMKCDCNVVKCYNDITGVIGIISGKII